MIKDGVNGLLSPVGDASGLSKQVLQLILNKARQQELISEASKTLLKFSKSSMAKKTLKVYEEVLGTG